MQANDTAATLITQIVPQNDFFLVPRYYTINSDDASCHEDISVLVTSHKYVTNNKAVHNTGCFDTSAEGGGVGGGGGWCPEAHGGVPGQVSPVLDGCDTCTIHLQQPCPTEHRPLLADGPLGTTAHSGPARGLSW